jgi:hypothetical protein
MCFKQFGINSIVLSNFNQFTDSDLLFKYIYLYENGIHIQKK